jgi:hypothetical protein
LAFTLCSCALFRVADGLQRVPIKSTSYKQLPFSPRNTGATRRFAVCSKEKLARRAQRVFSFGRRRRISYRCTDCRLNRWARWWFSTTPKTPKRDPRLETCCAAVRIPPISGDDVGPLDPRALFSCRSYAQLVHRPAGTDRRRTANLVIGGSAHIPPEVCRA